MTIRTTKLTPERIRGDSIRNTAHRRGIKLMRRRDSWWIVGDDGEIVAGGRRGFTIDQLERLIREEGYGRDGRKPRAMAS